MKNSSRNYYNSHDNMSDIKESIEEYSMNFDKDSNAHSYQQQSISEDIQHSKTNKLASQSNVNASRSKKNLKTSKAAINEQTNTMKTIPPTIKETLNEEPDTGRRQQAQFDRPIDLGFQIWQTIHQRFYQTNKIATQDPDVLYNFYISQRKVIKPRSMKILDEQFLKLEQLMPSMQNKMKIKVNFQKMLLYKPQDIQFSLVIAAQMNIKDRELKKNQKILHMEMKITQPKQKKPIQQVVDRLYRQTKIKQLDPTKMAEKEKQQAKIKLHQFGKKLSEVYLNAMREVPQNRVETLAKLHRFWSELYDREEYGLQWNEQTVQQDIKQYIVEQVQNLKIQYARKTGFVPTNGKKLLIFLNQNKNLYGIYINPISFGEYVKIFNEVQVQKQKKEYDLLLKKDNDRKIKEKEEELKKFGRPVSATPLTILAQPKNKNDYSDLYTKYSHDKLVSTLIMEDQLKKHRYAFQYSVYDLVEQLKIKGRVKPAVTESKDKDPFAKKGKIEHLLTYDDSIKKMLTKSFLNGSMIEGQSRDRVDEMLSEENLHEKKIWEKMSPLLQEAMLIKSYEQEWFREPILKYTNKITNKDLKHENDKSLFHQLFTHLDKLEPQTRQTQLHNLQIYIEASHKIHTNNARIKTMENKGQKFYHNQRKLMYADLVQRVIHFMKLQSEIREGKTEAKITKRDFINQTYKLLLKSHKDAVKKYFNAVDIEGGQCPNLLRYQFYRIAKQINPITFQRDPFPTAPNWIPTKKTPEDFNYKTHNKFSNVYNKNKTRVVDPEPPKRAQSLWGKKNLKDREKLLMTYSDAKECYFHPQIKKQDQ